MKTMTLTLVMMVSVFSGFGQFFRVHVDGFQLYSRPKGGNSIITGERDSMKYGHFQVVNIDYCFDLDNNKFYQHDHLANSFWEGSIDTVKLYENAVEVIVGNASFTVISKDNSSESEVFIVEYQESSYTEGFFSMYEDFDCDSK